MNGEQEGSRILRMALALVSTGQQWAVWCSGQRQAVVVVAVDTADCLSWLCHLPAV